MASEIRNIETDTALFVVDTKYHRTTSECIRSPSDYNRSTSGYSRSTDGCSRTTGEYSRSTDGCSRTTGEYSRSTDACNRSTSDRRVILEAFRRGEASLSVLVKDIQTPTIEELQQSLEYMQIEDDEASTESSFEQADHPKDLVSHEFVFDFTYVPKLDDDEQEENQPEPDQKKAKLIN